MNQEQIEEYLTEMLEKSEDEIDILFNKRLEAIFRHLSQMFRKYPDGEIISRSEIYKYRRFQKEMEFIKQNIQADYMKLYKEIENLMKSQYIENYLRSAYVYEMSATMSMGYQIPSAQVVLEAITNPIAELALNTLLNQHRNEILRKIRIEISQGILAGEGYAQIAERLERTINFSKSKALRVARTESGRAQSKGRLASGEQASKYAELTKFWMAELDTRTRHSHRKLDSKKANAEGYFTYGENKTLAPSLWLGPDSAKLSINCRCDIGYMVNNKLPDTRRVRNYSDESYQRRLAERMDQIMTNEGKTEKQALRKARKQIYPPNIVEKYRAYEEWLKDQPKGA